jgi:PPOX class probable F420-dependent enzyme
MDEARRGEFLKQNHRAVLATRRRDGTPQLSPVVFALDDEGRLLFSTPATTAKAKNVRRDPRVSVCVLNDRFFGDWAQVDGQASVIEMPDALPVLRQVYRAISGEHPDWEEFDRDMVAQGRVVLAVRTGQQANQGGQEK